MRIDLISIFPDYFAALELSLVGKAITGGLLELGIHDLRDWTHDRHRTVDDTPSGGGVGMVLKADVLAAAIDAAAPADDPRPRLLMSPRGAPLDQARVRALAAGPGVLVICGRFEGVDQRVIEGRGLEEVSIGDYVLSGGELAAMVLLDAAIRLLPGVMGKEASGEDESFSHGLLEYPHYTRPAVWEGRAIPDVLVSGDHGRIARWRREQSEALTQRRRPDLWRKHRGEA